MREPLLAKFLKYCVYASAFVPLVIFSQFISPFHFGKVVVFRSLVEIMAVFYLLLVWRYPSYLPKISKIFWGFFGFVLAFSLTTITSIQPYESFWGSLERMGGLWTFWHYFAFFIMATSILRNRQDWLRLFKITIAAGVLSAFYGFGQKTDMAFFVGSGNRARIFGTIGNAALFGGYQLLVLFLALTLISRPRNTKGEKIFYGFGILIMLISVFMTAVRGTLLGFGVGAFLFAVLHAFYGKSVVARKAVTVFTALVLLFFVSSLLFRNSQLIQGSRYLNRLTNLSPRAYTVQTRMWAWQAGLKGWSENPKTVILGWGPENFNIPFSKNFNPKFFEGHGSETLFDRAHNMFVEILVTMGLVGLASYLGLFTVIFGVLKNKMRQWNEDSFFALGFIPLMVAYIIHNSFIFDTSANFLVFFTILGFISFISAKSVGETVKLEKNQPKHVNKTIYQLVAVFLVLAIGFLIYRTNILPSRANYTTTRAIVRGWDGDFEGAVEKYRKALSYDVPGKYEFRHRFALYLLEYAGSRDITPQLAEVIKFAIEEVGKNDEDNFIDYLPKLYLSRLNIILGKDDPKSQYNNEALKHAFGALKISPNFVRTYYEVAQAYLNKKDYGEAAKYFKMAVELNPKVGVSYWYWGVTEFEKGNIELAAEIVGKALDNSYTLSEGDANRAVVVFARVNDFKRLVYVFQQLTALKPANPQYHASLAAAYANVGRIDDSVAEARAAVKADPSFEAEAKVFLKQLGREL